MICPEVSELLSLLSEAFAKRDSNLVGAILDEWEREQDENEDPDQEEWSHLQHDECLQALADVQRSYFALLEELGEGMMPKELKLLESMSSEEIRNLYALRETL